MTPERRCYSFRCALYPRCARAAGSVCSLDWDEEAAERQKHVIGDEECYDLPERVLFKEKEA